MRARTVLAVAAAATTSMSLLAGVSGADAEDRGDRRHGPYEIALIGDMPYGDTGRAQFPGVIADVNAHRVAFTTFDGDIKNGKERCDQPIYDAAVTNFDTFDAPLVYVPGDNEWTDCDRASNGAYDPNERLALIRRMFAAGPDSFGRRTLALARQAGYPENVRWQYGPVTYLGLNVPGSDNNAPQFDAAGTQVDGDAAEYAGRNAADLDWLERGFAAAGATHSAAVMIVVQADMWSAGDPTTHFADLKTRLARLSIGFAGQVVLVNGDSHFLQIDKPLTDRAGQTIENFTRVQTFGSDQNHWVGATVDPRDPDVFTFHQHIVAANVPAYVAP
ncbi:hypothetical protein ACL02O_06025 [Micromonospora sp. MS34]|uniref:hypothetical protein n=1 Tax=Micromonospora sp. MS34 TaxID=3385971 RepID=UPI0039A08E33